MGTSGNASESLIRITIEDRPPASVARVSGEVDVTSAPRLQAELFRLIAEGRPVILDLAGVSYFDLAGVRAIEAVAAGNGASVVLASAPRAVIRILEIVWPESPVRVLHSVNEAIAHLTGGGDRP